jgi:hypothetical protein
VRLLICAAAVTLLGCSNPTSPSTGTASVAITAVGVENGGSALQGRGVDVTVALTAGEDLLRSNQAANPFVGPRLPFYVCLSADGSTFTSTCLAGIDLGEGRLTRVIGPTASFNISATTHLIAFVIPAAQYGLPVTAFGRFGTGDSVPASALAVHVLPWVINWEAAAASSALLVRR